MKSFTAFIKKGTIFITGFLVVVLILQAIILFAIRHINVGEFGVLNKLNRGEINADILISGSSRSLKAINPEVIKDMTGLSCYNISSDGSDLGVQLPKLRWYLNRNQKPKYLIQDLSEFGGSISNTIYEPYKYLAYLSDDSLYSGLLKIDKRMRIHKYLYPTNLVYFNFDFYVKLFQELYLSVKKSDFLINGFYPDNSRWSGNMDLFKEEHPNGLIPSLPNEYISYLVDLVHICKENDITLILTVLPYYYLISEDQVKEVDVISFYSSLEDSHTVYLFDYSKGAISEDVNSFYNFTHLNNSGATMLSELLSRDLLEILK